MRKAFLLSLPLATVLIACQSSQIATTIPEPTPTPSPPTENRSLPTPTPTPPNTHTPKPPPSHTTTPPPSPSPTPLPLLTGSGGGRIVFSSRRGEGDYEVYAMNADGTDKRQLTRDTVESENPAWSPDGTRFAYTLDDYSGGSDIYVRNADGSGKRRLTREGNAGSAAWSPDGTQIAVSRHAHGRGSDLWLIAVPDGTGPGGGGQRLTETGNLGVFSPSWSPDGRYVVCVVDTDPDPTSWELTLNVLDVEKAVGNGGATIADMRSLPPVGDSFNDWPAWSPTGSPIAFSAVVDGHRDIYLVNPDGTGLQQVTDTPEFDEFAPAWSPDGTHIVFQANPDAQWDIYRMRADGSDRRQLTTDAANDTAPSWAP